MTLLLPVDILLHSNYLIIVIHILLSSLRVLLLVQEQTLSFFMGLAP